VHNRLNYTTIQGLKLRIAIGISPFTKRVSAAITGCVEGVKNTGPRLQSIMGGPMIKII